MANEIRVTIAPHRSFVCWIRNGSLRPPMLTAAITFSLLSLSLFVKRFLPASITTFTKAGLAILVALAIVALVMKRVNKKANQRGGPYQVIFTFLVKDWERAQGIVGIKPTRASLRWLATKNPRDIVGWTTEERMSVLTEYASEYAARKKR